MAQIIEFPNRENRDWAAIEESLIEILREAEVPLDAESELLSRMKVFCDLLQMQFKFTIPEDCPKNILDELDSFVHALQERSNKLILDRLCREIEILKSYGCL